MKFRSHDQLARAIYPAPVPPAPANIPKSAEQQMGERIYGDHADPLKANELNINPALESYFEGKRSQYAYRGNTQGIAQLEQMRPQVEAFARKAGITGASLQKILSEQLWFENNPLSAERLQANLQRTQEVGSEDAGGSAAFDQRCAKAKQVLDQIQKDAPLWHESLVRSGAQTSLDVVNVLAQHAPQT